MTSGYAADFLEGGGEMGRRIRAHDWAGHPMGPPEGWPQGLRTVVRLMLTTGHPTLIFWGAPLYCLYNDAFAKSLGPEKHPAMLGAEARVIWAEVWDIAGADIEGVYAGAGSLYLVNQLVPIERHGKLEPVYWTYSYSPIDDAGGVGGVLVLANETTRGVIERRHDALAELADRFRDVEDPDEIAYTAAEMLGQRLGVSRAGYGTIDTQAETIRIERDWNAPGVNSIAGVLNFRDYGSYIDDLKAGRTAVVTDAELDPRTRDTADRLKAISAQAFINMPVTEQGDFVALLFLNHAEARPWTEDEIELIQDVAERTRNAVARREAEQALRKNEARLRFLDTLGRETAQARDADAVMAVTTRLLGEHLAGSDCAYADMEPDEDMFNIRGDWHRADVKSIVGRYSLASFGTLAMVSLKHGHPLVIDDTAVLGEDGAQAFADIGSRAIICMPFLKEGRLTALMAIHDTTPRHWTADELGLLREVTERSWAHIERVRAEAALRESESRLRIAVVGARIGTWDWDLKTMRGRWSPRTCEILGVAEGEDVTDEQRLRTIHPDDRDRAVEAVRQAIRSGTSFATEYRIVRPDGGVRWIATRGIVERDAAGWALRTTGIVRDVTQRREAQEALKALNETLEQQVAARTAERDRMWRLSGDLFLVIGQRWEIRAVNPAVTPLLGYTPEEVVGERFVRFFHPDEFEQLTLAIRVVAQAPLRDFVARLRAKDGTWRRFAWSAATGQGEAYVIGRDVTEEVERREELERAQEALRQAQKMESLGQLTGGVAHDFNNLLTPILGSLDLLRRRIAGEREQRWVAAALESAERARTLVQRLLAFARRQPLRPGPVDLAALVTGMSDLIASTSGPQIKLGLDLAEPVPAALADANQLEMAVLNLAVNARDAMPDGGQLTLSVHPETLEEGHRSELLPGHYVRLCVADTGAGMDEETMARAVEPFFSTKGIGKGTGLGLSMVHGLVSQLGGAMLLSSKPGLGTLVELYLPVAEGEPNAEHQPRTASIGDAAGTVLLVDDEAPVRAATGELLRDLGYRVIEAEGAREALAYLAGYPVDYLVTDHLMPGMQGSDLVREVRTRHPGVKTLIVSGYADLDGISPDLPRLAKPFRQDELAASLAGLG
ncbi:PAS domain-containing protein [Sphingomonas sp. HF-S4]|uniref:histidine kinase n=1 Tax=Sphingomonas agrestis TaxID=3080540 RepID=A0ABU3Y3J0_9SPHN|nr:PAS domain-containing protein [Sphingomonas sp. HF-S4]MDV3455652.1 PAS domain-containing protein [Sphingomonas sp. HF-S4]